MPVTAASVSRLLATKFKRCGVDTKYGRMISGFSTHTDHTRKSAAIVHYHSGENKYDREVEVKMLKAYAELINTKYYAEFNASTDMIRVRDKETHEAQAA